MILHKPLVLASRSPRRQSLLRLLGLEFEVRQSGVEEEIEQGKMPPEIVLDLAERKARDVGRSYDNAIVIGADTIVVLNGDILGKPADAGDAVRMLKMLSGRTHEVYTGFALHDKPSGAVMAEYENTAVTFRILSSDEIDAYIMSGSPMDKAGAYGIQDDFGAVFVERIDGCFYNVVGFPLTKFYCAIQVFQQQLGLTGK
jgi:septum formation protein